MRAALFTLLLTGCVGELAGPRELTAAPKDTTPPSACTGTPQTGASVIRRMTNDEYDNTVRDLLGDSTHPAAEFSAEEEALGFNNNSAALSTSSALVEKQLAAAEGIATRLIARLDTLPWYRCDRATLSDVDCARQYIEAFGRRAYRRTLDQRERDALYVLYGNGAADGGFLAGIELVTVGALMSPDFLYRVENSAPSGLTQVSDVELASRLSYLLWGSMPDDALLAAAERGELHTPEQLAAAADRLLADSRARATVVEFHRQWLDFDRIQNVGKAAAIFPRGAAPSAT